MTRPKLLSLEYRTRVVNMFTNNILHIFGTMANDDDYSFGTELNGTIKDVIDKGLLRKGHKNLCEVWIAHTFALSGREDCYGRRKGSRHNA